MSRSGCAILDFQMFSNTSICFRIEMAAEDVGQFYANLLTTELRLSDQSVQALSSFADRPGAGAEVAGTLEITFLHSDPDLKHAVPAIG
ncbi:MAG: hypothetical protein K0R39_3404 [Symbiobacteriaceae bacterium]|jgi:hypothetical protein|nr:hypothetical protein [Symbiobacteriaceae bacterium]